MISSEQRKGMIDPCCPFLSISTQCQLLTLTRSGFYYMAKNLIPSVCIGTSESSGEVDMDKFLSALDEYLEQL